MRKCINCGHENDFEAKMVEYIPGWSMIDISLSPGDEHYCEKCGCEI